MASQPPAEITASLERFKQDHPTPEKTAFIMMQFGDTRLHDEIVEGIRSALKTHGFTALRADDKRYNNITLLNIQTYIYGCGFGIAVFERLEAERFNPNVALEVGWMFGLRKPVCLLKDKTLPSLQTDLVGNLYQPFDPQDPKTSIPPQLDKWMRDESFI